MTFAHDTELALVAAATLVNTASDGGHPAAPRTDLVALPGRAGLVRRRAGDPAELDAVRALRPRLRELWRLAEAELVPALNEILAEADALPQLVDHDDLGWHIHAVPQDAPLATRMAVEAAMAFIDVVRAGELDRLKPAPPRTATTSWSTCRATAPSGSAREAAATARTCAPTATAAGGLSPRLDGLASAQREAGSSAGLRPAGGVRRPGRTPAPR